MHANAQVLNRLFPANNRGDLSSSSSTDNDASSDSLLPPSTVFSSNYNANCSRSITSSSSSGISSSSNSSSTSSSSSNNSSSISESESDDENNDVISNVDKSKRKRNGTSPIGDPHAKRKFVGRFPVNGEDYSALDIEFGSSDGDDGVVGGKSPDFEDDRGNDMEGKFSSDDDEEEMEDKFSDDNNDEVSGGVSDDNVKLQDGKASKEKTLGQIRKDIFCKLDQLKHWVSKAEDPAQLQSFSNALSFCTNCIQLSKS